MVDETEAPGLMHRYARVNGIRMHYVEQGQGPLVVLLHGFPEFWYSWRHQLPALAQHFRVVAPDQRGYNLTDKPEGVASYGIAHLTADVAALIEQLGEREAIIVGHDWGGGVAWSFAMDYPQMTRRLIVLNCPHPAAMMRGLRTWRQLRKSWYFFFFQLPRLPEFAFRANNFAALSRGLRSSAVNAEAFGDDDLRAYREALAQPGALTGTINWYRALMRDARGAADRIRTITVPTLLVWGEQDIALGKELTFNMRQCVPNIRKQYVPDSGHWVQQERPDLVNRYILDFLLESPSTEPTSSESTPALNSGA